MPIEDIISFEALQEQIYYLNIGNVYRKRYERLTKNLKYDQLKNILFLKN